MAGPYVEVPCEVDDDPTFRLFGAIELGLKRFELRRLRKAKEGEVPDKWWRLYPGAFEGATLVISCRGDARRVLRRKVRATTVHEGFRAAMLCCGVQACVPGARDVEDALERVYRRCYAGPGELDGTVLAIELE
jgi:hypothetical protein